MTLSSRDARFIYFFFFYDFYYLFPDAARAAEITERTIIIIYYIYAVGKKKIKKKSIGGARMYNKSSVRVMLDGIRRGIHPTVYVLYR